MSSNAQPPGYNGKVSSPQGSFMSPDMDGAFDRFRSNPLVAAAGDTAGASAMAERSFGFDPLKQATSVLQGMPDNNQTDAARGFLGLGSMMAKPARPMGSPDVSPSLRPPGMTRNAMLLSGFHAPRRWA